MNKYPLLLIILLFSLKAIGQKKYFTRNGHISFQAGTALEDIDAVNNSAASVFDAGTGQLEYSVLIKGFEFKRSLMQDHFNENYMESDKYPKSVFKGKITNVEKVNFQKEGTYPVNIKGILEMHGVKKEIEIAGTIKVAGQNLDGIVTFSVLLSDYNISVPGLVKDKIAKTVNIAVKCNYSILK